MISQKEGLSLIHSIVTTLLKDCSSKCITQDDWNRTFHYIYQFCCKLDFDSVIAVQKVLDEDIEMHLTNSVAELYLCQKTVENDQSRYKCFINTYITIWNNYCITVKKLGKLFEVLNRTFCNFSHVNDEKPQFVFALQNPNIKTTHQLMYDAWLKVVLRMFSDFLLRVLLADIHLCRSNMSESTINYEIIMKSLYPYDDKRGLNDTLFIKNIYDTFVSDLIVSCEYYRQQIEHAHANNSSFIEAIYKRSTFESSLWNSVFNKMPLQWNNIRKNVYAVFLNNHNERISTHFINCIKSSPFNADDIKIIRLLMDEYLPLKDAIESSFDRFTTAHFTTHAPIEYHYSTKKYVDYFTSFKSCMVYFNKIIIFLSSHGIILDENFKNAVSCYISLDKSTKSHYFFSELLVEYIHFKLTDWKEVNKKKKPQMTNKIELDSILEMCLAFIPDIDFFISYHIQKATERLMLREHTRFLSIEKHLNDVFSKAFEDRYDNKLGFMIKDIEVQSSYKQNFNAWKRKTLDNEDLYYKHPTKTTIDFTFLRASLWDIPSFLNPNTEFEGNDQEIVLPPFIHERYQLIKKFFNENFDCRTLHLSLICSYGIIKTYIGKRLYEIMADTFTLLILFSFNDYPIQSTSDIYSHTKIPLTITTLYINALCSCNCLEICSETAHKNIICYHVNPNFFENHNFINLLPVIQKIIANDIISNQSPNDNPSLTSLLSSEDINHLIRATIVRKLKQDNACKKDQLLAFAKEILMLRNLYSDEQVFIDQIEYLIERSYIRKHEVDEDLLIYNP